MNSEQKKIKAGLLRDIYFFSVTILHAPQTAGQHSIYGCPKPQKAGERTRLQHRPD
jgi:hypothetical protein